MAGINSVPKEMRVLWEEELPKAFEDLQVLSKLVSKYPTDQGMMARTNETIWVPQPAIAVSYDGPDNSNRMKSVAELSVPVTISTYKSSPATIPLLQMRDPTQLKKYLKATVQKIASDVNQTTINTITKYASNFVKRSGASVGYDDVSLMRAVFDETGVTATGRKFVYNSRDGAAAAGNLASRGTVDGKVLTAYEKAQINEIADFDTFQSGYLGVKAAAAGGGSLTIDTRASANNYFVPKATTTATTGELSNYDNRFQTITISSTTGVAAQDRFTIAGIYNVNKISKLSTNQLKTHTVVSVLSATQMVITPPIISNQGGSVYEAQYQNCTATTTASNAAITFLNTASAGYNVAFQEDAVLIVPGRMDNTAEMNEMMNTTTATVRYTTDSGIELINYMWFDATTKNFYSTTDGFWGVSVLDPEQCGVMMFNQT